MTDPELLELAAKAARLCYVWRPLGGFVEYPDGPRPWNPLLDDGDALRLAVELQMFDSKRWLEIRLEETMADPSRSDAEIIRRAIVRRAAEIGEYLETYRNRNA